jgi:MFS family permease
VSEPAGARGLGRELAAIPPATRRVLFGCFVAQMGLGCGYIFGPTLKFIVAEFEWSRAAFSAGGAPLLLAMALASPLVGDLTERFGTRRVVALATLLLGVALFLFSRMESLLSFYVTCAIFGVALTGLGDIPIGALASRWVERGRGLVLGFVYVGSNAGGAVVPLAAVALASAWSWRAALVVVGVAAVATILPITLWTLREPDVSVSPSLDRSGEPAPGPPDDAALDLSQALRTRTFWVLAFTLFTFYFYYLAVNQHLVPFLSDLGYSDAEAAAGFSGAVALGILAKLGIGVIADRVPSRTALLANFALLTLASWLLLAVGTTGALPVFLVAHGFATAAENVLLPLIVAHCFGVRNLARIYGALMLALAPGGILGPIFAGAVFDRTGGYTAAFVTFAALNLAGLGSLLLVRRETGRE